jgi:rhamnosyltransferase
MTRFAVIVPALNAAECFKNFLPALAAQTVVPDRFLVLDSESDDDTVRMAKAAGAEVFTVRRSDFNHGGTRMLGVDLVADCEIAVFLTQDAILADPRSLLTIISDFGDPLIAASYGRQLPHVGAGSIESFARMFNYPDQSENRSADDIGRIGFRTCFCSNSFAAYRIRTLVEAGGFPRDAIFGEDALAVAKLILLGNNIRYNAKAIVHHSHHYSFAEEFRRYFDVGVMHHRAADLLQRFGSASSTGRVFVMREFAFLARTDPTLLPEALLRTGLKYFSYKLGRMEERLPRWLKYQLSMNRRFWNQDYR